MIVEIIVGNICGGKLPLIPAGAALHANRWQQQAAGLRNDFLCGIKTGARGAQHRIKVQRGFVDVDDVGGSEGRGVAPSGVEGGIVITGVENNSPAAEAGLAAGDLVEELNGREINDLDDFEEAIEDAKDNKDKPVLFLIKRGGTNRYVAVKPGQD